MKKTIYFLLSIFVIGIFSQCKKGNQPKLENPFGLLLLGSDTSLQDGRYVIRTTNGCTTPAATLRCDYIDGVIGYNGSLPPIDHITINDIDSAEVWYVKKVRYVSPDPFYALAFGYRVYQRTPDGGYRFLSLTATGSTVSWTDDEIGFTYATDNRAKSVKVDVHYLDRYPADPPARRCCRSRHGSRPPGPKHPLPTGNGVVRPDQRHGLRTARTSPPYCVAEFPARASVATELMTS